MIVLVDNGHGAETPGKRSPDGKLREYEFNRAVAKLVVARLRASGVEASLLVPEEEDISLSERVRRANRIAGIAGVSNVMLISIHANAFGDDWNEANGWSAYTSPGWTKSDAIAQALYAAAEQVFPEAKMRKDKEANFYILRKTACPAVLTENFFMTNRKECSLLLSEEGRSKIADLHVKGILDYLNVT